MYIFLYGADNFRSLEKLSELKNKYLEKNSSGRDLSFLDYGDPATLQPLQNLLGAQGLFSTKRLIVVKNSMTIGSPDAQKEILNLLKADKTLADDQDTTIVFHESSAPKKNGALYKFLIANSKKQEFAPLDGPKLSAWALSFAKKLDPSAQFSQSALNMLLAFTGNDLYVLSNEIAKLVNYKDGKMIEKEDIELLVKAKVDSTMFETIESLVGGNKAHALELFHEQIAKGEDVYYILSMYTYQIRTLLKIGDFYWQGLTSAPQIAQAAKIHPYVVQKSLNQLRNLSQEKTKQMLRDLADIDHNAKTGKVDLIMALDTFIVSL